MRPERPSTGVASPCFQVQPIQRASDFRATNLELTHRLAISSTIRHLNEYKAAGYVQSEERKARRGLRTPERLELVTSLVDAVMEYIDQWLPPSDIFRPKKAYP